MDLLKLENQTLASLYELFKDNDKITMTEDDKYAEGTKKILGLEQLNLKQLRDLRNQFVMTVSDLMHAARILMEMESNLSRIYNIYSNMLQYVTTEIDYAIYQLGGEV